MRSLHASKGLRSRAQHVQRTLWTLTLSEPEVKVKLNPLFPDGFRHDFPLYPPVSLSGRWEQAHSSQLSQRCDDGEETQRVEAASHKLREQELSGVKYSS